MRPHVFVPFIALSIAVSSLSAQDNSARAAEILKSNCLSCHGAAKASGLDLRTRETMLAGGEKGPAVVPADPSRSLLWLLSSHQQKPGMPPGKKLPEADLAVLKTWIEEGAVLPKVLPEAGGDVSLKEAIPERPITAEERRYWAFRKPTKVSPPSPGNPVDVYLRAALRTKGMKAAGRADRRTLIRRAYLDLLGLPPTPEEVESFAADGSPEAWPKLVDRLLASPHYGERWGRHWLDLVRYADSGGFEFDVDRPDSWRYRDYVISAFNKDKPYDVFVKEQLAGDEINPESKEALIATGYLRVGPRDDVNNPDPERERHEALDDLISTTSLAFSGLTVGCARCHDHKFDPIPQKDYYKLQAVFSSVKPLRRPLVGEDVVRAHAAETDRITGLQKPLRKEKQDLEEPFRQMLVNEEVSKLPEYLQVAWRTPEGQRTEGQKLNVQQIERTLRSDNAAKRITEAGIVARMPAEVQLRHKELAAKIGELERQKPKPFEGALSVGESGRVAQPAHFLHRGSVDAKGPVVAPGVLSVVSESDYTFPDAPEDAKSSWRRKAFAEWLVSTDNPLTARVMVTRIWQHHFGEGLVRTPSNFGKMGEPPSHPELLDWLAVEFMQNGWSVKHMHRLVMNSESYQMSSDDISENLQLDRENRLWWRMPRNRLEAEAIRDQILAVAGSLDKTLGGPGVYPYIAPELYQSSTGRKWPGKPDDDPSTWRRSIYVYSKRSIRYPMFEAFDQPNLANSCERRNRSTIAPQALLLMNNNFALFQSKQFAERLRQEAGDDPGAQIERAFRLALGRPPSEREKANSIAYVRGGSDRLDEFCHAMFNLNEFVYRP
ncbi:MAG TPA: PSD1 and planctomycete cytochrome C domain-containing protein [Bryobacteraceae bacterium]|nr:PSD1 and planctomycete cytochrome C domain-containing protein [Bryobacteraceae bacterium]